MVKFIPLTCEKCGGDLSVKDGLKFVTCGHCQTKFQVAYEEKTVYLEKIALDVKTSIEQEYCEIIYHVERRIFGGPRLVMWGRAIGKNGKYTAGKTWELKGEYPSNADTEHNDAHSCLVLLLTRSGWQPNGRKEYWYSDTFVRTPLNGAKEGEIFSLEEEFGKLLLKEYMNYREQVREILLKSRKMREEGERFYLIEQYKFIKVFFGLGSEFIKTMPSQGFNEEGKVWLLELAELRKRIELLA